MTTTIIHSILAVWLIAICLGTAATVFWIVEIIDIARRRFENDTMKIVWLLVVCFSHVIGALVYFFVGRSMGTLPEPPTRWG